MDLTKARQESSLKYPSLNKMDVEIRGQVKVKKLSKGWSGTYAIDLSNNTSFSLSGVTINRNYKYKYRDLMDIAVGDSIWKPKLSDTVYVYRNNTKYFYILGKIIG